MYNYLQRCNHNMDTLDNFLDAFLVPLSDTKMATLKIDVQDNGQSYTIMADLPNIKKEQIGIEYENEVLTIKVTETKETEEKKTKYLLKERKVSSMQRSLSLPNIDIEKVKAKLNDGVLEVTLPKLLEVNKASKIMIE